MFFNLCDMIDKKTIETEILLKGYYGLDNWLYKEKFETEMSDTHCPMAELMVFVDKCHALLSDKLLNSKDIITEYYPMPRLLEWMDKNYPQKPFETECDWVAYSEELVYDKLSIAKQTSFYGETPVWCDLLAGFALKKIGEKCSVDNRFQSFGFLSHIWEKEELSWVFFEGFTISDVVLTQAEKDLKVDPMEILYGSRMLEKASNTYIISGKNQQEILNELYWYEEDGGYVEFPETIIQIGRAYREAGKDDAFIALWKALAYPTLQYGLLYYLLMLPKDCIGLLKLFQQKGVDEVGLTLIRDYWFKQSVRCLENLLQFEEKIKSGEYTNSGIVSLETMKDDFVEGLRVNSKDLFRYFTTENLSRWVFSKNTLGDKPNSIYKEAYLLVLGILKDILSSADDTGAFSIDTKDLSYLIYLAKKALENSNLERGKQIELVILKLIDSGSFGWHGDINNEVIEQMFVIGCLLKVNHSDKEIINLVENRAVRYEGWGVTPISNISERSNSFAFLISAAMQHIDVENDFRYLVFLAIGQFNGSRMPNNALLAPLIMAELIVNQQYDKWRDWYEQLLLTEIESFVSLLGILIHAQSPMSTTNKALFDKRKKEEWNLIFKQYTSNHCQLELNKLTKLMEMVEDRNETER